MKPSFYLVFICTLLLTLVSCSEASHYNSQDARADLEAALTRYSQDPAAVSDSTLLQAETFFAQHDMDDELVRLLLLKAKIHHGRARTIDSRQQLLYAASIAEDNGSEDLKSEVYAQLLAMFPADTSMLRMAIQTQQRYMASRLQRDEHLQLGDIYHYLLLALLLIGLYMTHQSLKIRMQNAKITALRLELQNRDYTEYEGLSRLREDAAVMRFRTAFADRHTTTAADWAALHDAYTRLYPKFERRLREVHPLSAVEWQVCMLLRLDFSLSDIATFTLRSPATISTVRSRLYTKFFMAKGSASDWDQFIQTL